MCAWLYSPCPAFTEKTVKSSHIGHPITSHQIRTGVMLALDSDTGKEIWTAYLVFTYLMLI